jgi:hypothetical protein
LIESRFIADSGKAEFGAIIRALTEKGSEFREKGVAWWADLNFLQALKVTLLG